MLGFTPISTTTISSIESSADGATALTETLTITDVFLIDVTRRLSDTLVVSHDLDLTKESSSALSDMLTLTDDFYLFNLSQIGFEDDLLVSDVIDIRLIPFADLSDTLNLFHSLAFTVLPAQNWSDTLSIAVELVITRHRIVNMVICDLIILADSFKRTHELALDDTLTITDDVNGNTPLADTLLITDDFSTNAIFSLCTSYGYLPDKSLVDTLTITDSLTFNTIVGLPLSDTLTLQDSLILMKV